MAGRYDVRAALRGQQTTQPMPETADERKYKYQMRMIKSAEAANYDGNVDTYEQTKMLAMQLGVPIKQMKTSALRKFGIGAYSLLDTALLGLLPNDVMKPANEGDKWAQGVGTIGGLALPWGLPAKLARGVFGGAKAAGWMKGAGKFGGGKFGEGFGKGFNKHGWAPFGKGPITDKSRLLGPGGPRGRGPSPRGPIIDKTPIPRGPGGTSSGPMGGGGGGPLPPYARGGGSPVPRIGPGQQPLPRSRQLPPVRGPGGGGAVSPQQMASMGQKGQMAMPIQAKIAKLKELAAALNKAPKGQLTTLAKQLGINVGRGSAKDLRKSILMAAQKRLGMGASGMPNPGAIANYARGPLQGSLFG